MNKEDLIKTVAAASGLRVADATKAMNAFGTILVDCMSRGETISWYGVGAFSVREHKARTGRSPFTGLKIHIPARRIVKFSAGKILREAVMQEQMEK